MRLRLPSKRTLEALAAILFFGTLFILALFPQFTPWWMRVFGF
jgi:hypothetical protein